MTPELWVVLLGGISMALAAYGIWSSRKNRKADVGHTVNEMFDRLAQGLERRITSLEGESTLTTTELAETRDELARVRAENRVLRNHNRLLTEQVVSLGGTPRPMPDER